MTEFLAVFLGACLVNNLVLHHMLAAAPVAALSRRVDAAGGLGIAVALVIAVAAPLAWLLEHLLLRPLDLAHLRLPAVLVLVVTVAAAGQGVLLRVRPLWHNRSLVFFPLALMNSAILGAALLAIDAPGFATALASALGSGAGFALVCTLFAGLQERTRTADVPVAFRGVPVQLLAFAFLSMAFMGFAGLGAP
jgi:electron transport complex protein RnfA